MSSGAPGTEDLATISEELIRLRAEVVTLQEEVDKLKRARDQDQVQAAYNILEDPPIFEPDRIEPLGNPSRSYAEWRLKMVAKLDTMASFNESVRIDYIVSRLTGRLLADIYIDLPRVRAMRRPVYSQLIGLRDTIPLNSVQALWRGLDQLAGWA